ncbi:MAG: hypothetical protein HZA93_12830 [Verrucomicrobia bacterium]|nr:hypothetical protein [Verrucomicrobiota bacterium]
MLKTRHENDRPADPRCLETREVPAAFLRLQSPREQVALPYSSLLKLSLKTDGTALELSYVTHSVVIAGKNLDVVYKAVAEVEARLVAVVAADFTDAARLPSYMALVREIRIEPLDAEERRKR